VQFVGQTKQFDPNNNEDVLMYLCVIKRSSLINSYSISDALSACAHRVVAGRVSVRAHPIAESHGTTESVPCNEVGSNQCRITASFPLPTDPYFPEWRCCRQAGTVFCPQYCVQLTIFCRCTTSCQLVLVLVIYESSDAESQETRPSVCTSV